MCSGLKRCWKFKDEYVTDYVELIKSFQSLESQPEVWICYPVPAYCGRWGITDKVMTRPVVFCYYKSQFFIVLTKGCIRCLKKRLFPQMNIASSV